MKPDRRTSPGSASRPKLAGRARGAGVDPALVHYFFGAKTELFAAAMQLPVNPAQLVQALLAGGPELIGERLIGTFLSVWDHAANRDVFIGLLRSPSPTSTPRPCCVSSPGAVRPGRHRARHPGRGAAGQPGVLADLRLDRGPLHPADRAARLGPRRAGRGGGRATIQRYITGDLDPGARPRP
jgi:AcrR family transcriptional regulator